MRHYLLTLICGLRLCSASSAQEPPATAGTIVEEPDRAATEVALSQPSVASAMTGNLLYVAVSSNVFYALDVKTGLIKTFHSDMPVYLDAIALLPGVGLIATFEAFCRIVKINIAERTIQSLAGLERPFVGNRGCGSDGDGGPAREAAFEPYVLALDPKGDLYFIDWVSKAIRRIDAKSQVITTVFKSPRGLFPTSVAIDKNSRIVISQAPKGRGGHIKDQRLVVLDPATGSATPLIISSFQGSEQLRANSWDSVFWTRLTFDPEGNLYLTDDSRVFYIDLTRHLVSVVAGSPRKGFSGDGGPATQAQMYWPTSVTRDAEGNLYIADRENQRIRKVDAKTHRINTVAGNGLPHHTPGSIEVTQ
jgi:DNA-binding beta-propeller fold protein YncE